MQRRRYWAWLALHYVSLLGCAEEDVLGSYSPGDHHDQHARHAHQRTHIHKHLHVPHGVKVHEFEAAAVAAASTGSSSHSGAGGGDGGGGGGSGGGGGGGGGGGVAQADETGASVGAGGVLFKSEIPFTMSRGYRVYDAEVPPWVNPEQTGSCCTRREVLRWLRDAAAQTDEVRRILRRRYGAEGGHEKWEATAKRLFGPPPTDHHGGRAAAVGSGGDGPSSGGGPKTPEKDVEAFTNDVEERIASRMVLLLLEPSSERRFTFAFTGHSNAAGHGNYFDHTYPFAMARDLSVAFAQAGLHLAVQNFAAGGTSTIPTTGFCGRAAVGESVDVASWDFAMTEGGGKGQKQGESWIRSMLSLARRPAAGLLFVDAGGRAKKWASHYRAVGAFHSLGKVEKGLPLAANDTKWPEALRWLHPECKNFGENGTPKNTYCRQQKWGPAKDEMQWRPGRKGLLEAGVYDSAGKKLGGSCPGMVNWHDGHKLHQLKGAILAHFYARCLAIALRRLAGLVHALPHDAPDSAVNEALRKALGDVEVVNRRRPLPVPGADCKATPLCPLIGRLSCATGNEPRVGAALVGVKGETDGVARALVKPSLDSFNNRKRVDEERCTCTFSRKRLRWLSHSLRAYYTLQITVPVARLRFFVQATWVSSTTSCRWESARRTVGCASTSLE
jgi:hypothetical protein